MWFGELTSIYVKQLTIYIVCFAMGWSRDTVLGVLTSDPRRRSRVERGSEKRGWLSGIHVSWIINQDRLGRKERAAAVYPSRIIQRDRVVATIHVRAKAAYWKGHA
jgi:hypothetical protein